MANQFPRPGNLQDPAVGAIAIDYSGGDQEIDGLARSLYITTAGDLTVDTARGDVQVTLPFITGLAPLRITKIYQSGSTAAGQIWF